MPDSLLAVASRRPIVLDAAMGTRLIARGLDLRDDDPAFWNLSAPEIVLDCHRLDIAAGADAVISNTFGANADWLRRVGKADLAPAINAQAVRLAREAAGPDRFVLGSVGPSARSESAVHNQVACLVDAGVDAILFETQTEDSARLAIGAARRLTVLPILVSFYAIGSVARDRRMIDRGADVVGMNCATPTECLASGMPGLIQPNGSEPGKPSIAPSLWAEFVPDAMRRGVRFLGGCCGTTEAHVAAIRSALDSLQRDGV